VEVIQIPVLSDNYVYVLIGAAGSVAVVDPAVHEPVIALLESRGLALDFIFNTHHHRDHVGGNLALKEHFGCKVYGCAKDYARIPGIDRKLIPGEEFTFDGETVSVYECDGHTIGHISYWFGASKALFCGDTIFSLGCGKLFEGTPEQMWDSLAKLRKLPADSLLYCAHEYTLENAAFALRAEPGNSALLDRVAAAETLRRGGNPTVPMILSDELAANPFLRPESLELQKFVHLEGAELWRVFGAVRDCKDRFDAGEEI